MNIGIFTDVDFDTFTVGGYVFNKIPCNIKYGKKFRHLFHNANVSFSGAQENSILYPNGIRGSIYKPQKRKHIEDILLIGSLLNGFNWELYSNKSSRIFPVIPCPYLEDILFSPTVSPSIIEDMFNTTIECIKAQEWQKQFENGFHLRMLKNHANILNEESRFLANFVIWEWLYPHLKNKEGALIDDESGSVVEIFKYIVEKYWGEFNIKNNIYRHIRNQLTHSGKFPINRGYKNELHNPELWMKNLSDVDIGSYISFFNQLTQVMVLKTININADGNIPDFSYRLNNFLKKGRIC